MKKVIRIIGKVMLWVVYFIATDKERRMYMYSKSRGRVVLGVKDDAFGSTYTLGRYLDEGEEPYRNFLTWKEFRKAHNF